MALQLIGKHDFYLLSFICNEWVCGNFFEQRALAAGICEPELLSDPRHAELALQLLVQITQLLSGVENRKLDGFRVLRKGLGYCWSVAVAANPEFGKPAFEKLLELDDKDVNWIIRENLKKNRQIRLLLRSRRHHPRRSPRKPDPRARCSVCVRPDRPSQNGRRSSTCGGTCSRRSWRRRS